MSDPIAEGWVTTEQAAELAGYHIKYLQWLARSGRIEARKVNRDWLIDLTSLLAYKAGMDRLGPAKHSPWREDLVEQERGRR